MTYSLSPDYTPLWWEETDPDAAGRQAISWCQHFYKAQESRRARDLRAAKLYCNQNLQSLYDYGVASDIGAGVYLSVNVTESCTNTLAAKMTRTRVRPTLMTEKGNRTLQRQAEGGTAFIDGVYHSSELHEGEGEQIFVDGCLFANGFALTAWTPDEEIVVERVLPDEMIFDETEGVNGRRSLVTSGRLKFIHREILLRTRDEHGKMFGDDPAKRQAIKNATGWKRPGGNYPDEGGDMIPVWFAWHLPASKKSGEGRYIVAIGGDGRPGATLFSKKWTRTRFPWDMFVFQRRPTGVWGRSLAEQLLPIQFKINELIEQIDGGEQLNAVARIFYQDGAIDPDDFDNELGRLIKILPGHTVNEVKELLGNGASPQTYKSLEDWVRRAYEITGISMLSATAEKPEGITSAVALRELLDREDLRFSMLGKRWERFHRDVGETILDTAAEMAEAGRTVMVNVPADKFVKRVDFADLKIDRERHIVTVSAASALPTTPAARKQYADDLLTRGAISMARYLEIIDESGDVHGVTSLVTAVQESIDLDIEDILERGKWRAPEKLRDPALARDTAIAVYAKSVHEQIPEKRLELLRRYILLATKYAGPAAAAPQQASQQATAAENQQAGAPPPPSPDQAASAMMTPDLQAAQPTPVPAVTPAQ